MKVKLLRLKKISWKLTLIYSLIFSMILVFLSAGILYGVKFFLVQQSISQVNDSSKITVNMIMGTPDEQTTLTDQELLNEAETNSDISIIIADAKGKIVNTTKNVSTNKFDIMSHLNMIWKLEINGQHIIVKNSKVMVNGRIKAYLQIVKNLEKEYAFIKLLFIFLAIADCLGIIISIFVGYIISRKLLKPIDKISKTAKEISISDLNSRIEIGEADDELTRLAVTFNDMIERLRVSFEKQNQFVSDASHELRTPISVIQGYINLIDRWGKEDKSVLQESIEAIKNETLNMGDLVEKLLFLARGDIGTLKLHKEKIDLSELAEEVIKESNLIAPQYVLEFDVKAGTYLYADRKMIKQMFRALVDNSLKFTPEGGEIGIYSIVEKDIVKITVKDTGSGIPTEETENIFMRFYRVDKARTKESGGSGLGLSIVKWIVDAHDGRICIESIVGKGTSVIILLPNNGTLTDIIGI